MGLCLSVLSAWHGSCLGQPGMAFLALSDIKYFFIASPHLCPPIPTHPSFSPLRGPHLTLHPPQPCATLFGPSSRVPAPQADWDRIYSQGWRGCCFLRREFLPSRGAFWGRGAEKQTHKHTQCKFQAPRGAVVQRPREPQDMTLGGQGSPPPSWRTAGRRQEQGVSWEQVSGGEHGQIFWASGPG